MGACLFVLCRTRQIQRLMQDLPVAFVAPRQLSIALDAKTFFAMALKG